MTGYVAAGGWDTLTHPLSYAFFQKGLLVATLAGALLAFVGVYVTLRGMSYIGHGLSHAIFGGFAASQLVTSFYYVGAGIWGLACALAIGAVTRRHRIGADAAIGVITTASFALGVAVMSTLPRKAGAPSFEQALFGSILGISATQIWALIAVSVLTALVVGLRYRAMLFTTFDPEVADASGVRVARTDGLLMLILSLSILATMTIIGVTLVAAMLVIPPVIARMITDSFSRMLVLSTVIGAACGFVGMYASYEADVPSGTMIVLTGAALFCLTLAFTGLRGLRRTAGLDEHVVDAPVAVSRTAR